MRALECSLHPAATRSFLHRPACRVKTSLTRDVGAHGVHSHNTYYMRHTVLKTTVSPPQTPWRKKDRSSNLEKYFDDLLQDGEQAAVVDSHTAFQER